MDPYEKFTDAELVANCLAGSSDAARQLVERYSGYILTILRSRGITNDILRNHETKNDIEDNLQDVWASVFRALATFKSHDDSSFRRWIATIATNQAIRAWRQRVRRRENPLDDRALASPNNSKNVEIRDAINGALQRLPEKHRKVLELRYLHELTASETAARLGLSVPQVYERCREAKEALRRELEKQ